MTIKKRLHRSNIYMFLIPLVTAALPHIRRGGGQVRDKQYDYAGGFSHVMMELSDALPYQAFSAQHLD